jgi:hypothetical protein
MSLYSLLFRDNVPTIVLNQWEITADYLEDNLLDGVMPVLFADDVKAAEAAISDAPLTAKRDLERLAKMYFVPETLDLTQAEAVVRKPRLGEVIFWYKNLNLERLFAEDRLAAAYNARNRAALQEAAAASNGSKKFSKSSIRKHEFWLCRNLKKKFIRLILRHTQAPSLLGLSRAQALI